jgi:hypothetical protein
MKRKQPRCPYCRQPMLQGEEIAEMRPTGFRARRLRRCHLFAPTRPARSESGAFTALLINGQHRLKIPRAVWWLLAPLSWVWQYVAYVPAYWLTNLVVSLFSAFAV